MNNIVRIFVLCICPIFIHGQNNNEIFSMFYNVENLFDTINNPFSNDDEFTPQSKKKWTKDRYNQKITQLF